MSRSPVRVVSSSPSADELESGRKASPSQVRLKASANDGSDVFEHALRAVQRAPEDEAGWDEVERLCDVLEQPEPVAEAFLKALVPGESEALLGGLSLRAHAFFERWFGDDAATMGRALSHILTCLPEADWPFDALVRQYTVAGRWDELLDAYDQRLSDARTTGETRTRLLLDAVHVAKDFADRPERALTALRELVRSGDAEPSLVASLARAFRERGLYRALLGLWRVLLEEGEHREPDVLRLDIAELHLERLAEPAACVEELCTVLGRAPGHEGACALLERVLGRADVPDEVRLRSLGLLRLHHDSAGRSARTARALETAIAFAPRETALTLRRELAGRLAAAGDDVAAMEQVAELLLASPGDVEARLTLRLLAERSGEHERHASALTGAAHEQASQAQRAELWLAAMELHAGRLCQPDEAVRLAQRVLGLTSIEPAHTRRAASCIAQLLAGKGREAERLEALERLCASEEHAHVRASLAVEISTALCALGEPERALALWEKELERAPDDERALGQAIALGEQLGQNERLVQLLEARAALARTTGQRRRDLARAAELLGGPLGRPEQAIDVWLRIRAEQGDDAELLGALDLLLSSTGRYEELARIFDGATQRERGASLEMFTRLGDVARTELGDARAAARAYARALELAPEHENARAGLRALLERKEAVREATAALDAAYVATDDWAARLELLDARLSATDDAGAQASWLVELAAVCEQRAKDPARALSLVGRALTRTPLRVHVERDLLRLAELTGRRREAAQALHWAAAVASPDRERAADLSALEARLLEGLGDAKGAADAYQAVVAVRPQARDDVHGLVRCAAQAGAYGLACLTLVRWCAQRAALDVAMLDSLEAAARGASGYVATRDALRAAIRAGKELSPDVEAGLELRLSHLCLVHCDDLVGAEAALRRALAQRPADEAALSLLAEVQRRSGSAGVIDTLLELDARLASGIALVREAAQRLERFEVETAQRRRVLERLYARATELLVREAGDEASEWTLYAVDRLVALELAEGRLDAARALADQTARLAVPDAARLRLRMLAARLLAQTGDEAGALLTGVCLLGEAGKDLDFVRFLAELAKKLGRTAEELELRRVELGLVAESGERLRLRLDIARLVESLEARDGRLSMLRQNLADEPGHVPSLTSVIALLTGQRRHRELVGLLSEQADAVARLGQKVRGAHLLVEAAALAERELAEPLRAVELYERSLALNEEPRVIDELVRLAQAEGDAVRSARWLARKLTLTGDLRRSEVAVELARAQLAAGQTDDAIQSLRDAFAAEPSGTTPAGKLLVEVLRREGRDEELADVLAQLAGRTDDRAETLNLSREAARLYHRALGRGVLVRPEALVEAGDVALSLAPEDVELCSMTADALVALGRHGDARQLLVHSLHQFGRRRSPERAMVHVQLARVHRAEGELTRACSELELALTMRPDDPAIIDLLSELAGEAGDLPRRERALRALYVCARRGPVRLGERVIGVSEVLFLLGEVASQRGDDAQASTMRESALAALRFGDAECERVKQALRARGSHAMVEQIVREELARATVSVDRARLSGELADVLSEQAERRGEALGLRLAALELDPRDPRLHEAALVAARKAGELTRYRTALESLRERLRRPGDAFARCEVCLRLGALRFETADVAGAQALYAEAESTGVREGDVCRALLEVAIARSDVASQERLLKRLDGLGAADSEGEGRVDLAYRLAEIRLGGVDTRTDGIARMREALGEFPRPIRAARIVLKAREGRSEETELLDLLRDIARGAGELDLVQLADLCGELRDDVALEVLLEEAEGSERSREALRGAPGTLRASLLVQRARLSASRGEDPARILPLLEKAIITRPGDVEAEQLLLDQYRKLGREGDALAFLAQRLESAASERNADAVVRYALLVKEQGGKPVECLPLYARAIELAPAHAGLREAQLAALAQGSAPRERAEALESALEHAQMREPAPLALEAAELYRALDDAEGRTRALSLGRRRAPRNVTILRALVEAVRGLDLPEVLAELLEDLAREEQTGDARATLLCEAANLRKLRLGDQAAALRLFERAVEARGDDVALRRSVATELLASGQPVRAAEHLAQAAQRVRRPSERAELLRERARALTSAGDHVRALADLEQAHTLDAQRSAPELLLALERVSSGEDDEPARAATSRLVALRRARGELSEAVALVEARLEHDPEDEEALGQLSELYEQLGQAEPLSRVLASQLERSFEGPQVGAISKKLADLLPRLREPAFVRRALARASAARPDDRDVEDALLSALIFARDHRGAAELLLERADRFTDPNDIGEALRRAAEQLLSAQAVGEVAEVLVRLRALFPADVDTAVALVDVLLEAGRHGEARLLLEAIGDRRPETPHTAWARVLVRLARAARGQGDAAGALELLTTARDADKSNRAILAELAVLAEEQGAWDVAEKALTSLLLLNDAQAMPRAEILLRRARVARHHAGVPRALMWAKKALEVAPGSAEVLTLIRELEAAS